MNTILIATDFSVASRNATIYGVQLAKEIDANIILFNAYDIPTPAAGLNVEISPYSVKVLMDQKLKDDAETYQYINTPSIETVCDEGAAADAIVNVANDKKVDFIIIGMKGEGKNLRKIFGSTATSLAKRTNIPLIVVPECARFQTLHNLVFASDSFIDSDKDLPESLKAITQLFKSKLNVVKVFNNKEKESFHTSESPKKLDCVACTFDTSFEYRVDTDLRHALNNFIQEHHCDMLVIVPHKHEWMERLFKKSETKNMIFHTHIPLLVLPEIPAKYMGTEKAVNSNSYS
jgi:nucleotide-binding universal stress UspA family protein